jgi:hypothetical protein
LFRVDAYNVSMASDEQSRRSLTRRQLAFVTRRQAAFFIGAAPLAAQAAGTLPQASAPPTQQAAQPPAPVDAAAKAQADVRKNGEVLGQIELPTGAEPAFLFRP